MTVMTKYRLATTLSGRRIHLTEDGGYTLCQEVVYAEIDEKDLQGRQICRVCEEAAK